MANFEDVEKLRRTIGKRLYIVRQQRRLFRTTVSEVTGIGEHLLRRIESGKTDPKLSHVMKLCTVYDIKLPILMSDSFEDLSWSGYYQEFLRQLGGR